MERAECKAAKASRPKKPKWEGLLQGYSKKLRGVAFFTWLVLAVSATFTQFGFIGIGFNGEYVCYAFGLLVPVMATALLLGKRAGALQGALDGAVLFAHARFMPLDLVERYFVSILNSVVVYAFVGFVAGLLLARALRNGPTGKRRIGNLAIAAFFTSVIASAAFIANAIVDMAVNVFMLSLAAGELMSLSRDTLAAAQTLSNFEVQIVIDFLLMFFFACVIDDVVRRQERMVGHVSVRMSFGAHLLIIVCLVFSVLAALTFTAVTIQCIGTAHENMDEEIKFIGNQLADRKKVMGDLVDAAAHENLPADVVGAALIAANGDYFIKGYTLDVDGTVVVFRDEAVLYSNNPAYPVGSKVNELFGESAAGLIYELAESGQTQETLYATRTFDEDDLKSPSFLLDSELGYMCAKRSEDLVILMAMPLSMVFASRTTTMVWSTVLSLLLLAVVYVLTERLLDMGVVNPIDRTNGSLARITGGDLDVEVGERGTTEFAALSSGINETVGALKGWIAEAEARVERELATAKAIQEGALPRVFPPFPEIGAFDIFASMDAAKEVGGDFYDYFLIDERTLGLLIADVSGKGIPGALFMMAAKTELENYMSTGMGLAEAIATANRRLCASNEAGMFVTVWAATLDWETGELTYVNAGHNFPLLRRGAGGRWGWLRKRCGLFLGTFETAGYRQETLTLEPGDELLLYTDGVNEAFDEAGEEYGNARLEAFLAGHASMHPRELVRSLRADVARWAGGAEQSDDVTVLALEYGVAPEVTGSVTLDAEPGCVDRAVALVSAELERRLCPIGVQRQVEVALEELLVNVCRYAYAGSDAPGRVQVSYAYGTGPSSITVEVRDQGAPFDPTSREDPAPPASIDEAPVGGLGILMVRRTMDDFVYMRDGDTNVVVFKKGW